MKCVILAGGLGTRIAEESQIRPKPMVEIGERPILWHIMKIYAHHGITDFVVCLGYRGYVIKEYFANFFLHGADVTFDIAANRVDYHNVRAEPWRVTLVDTGDATMTGGRLRRVRRYLDDDAPFCLTYGDGVGDIDIAGQIAFHRRHGKLATVTVVRPTARFGAVTTDGDMVSGFEEKAPGGEPLINGGYFVLSPKVIDLIDGDDTLWEREPMQRLVARRELAAWRHHGFWQPMDTLRDKQLLERAWQQGEAPWRVWS